jgi:hypothetical protein
VAYGVESVLEDWKFLPSISSQAAPTVAELAAGTDITNDIMAVTGFDAKAAFIDVPTMQGGVTAKITGRQTSGDSSLTFAEHTTFAANTIKAALAYGTSGFIVISRYTKTPIATSKVDVYPVKIGGNNRLRTADDAPAQYVVDFGVTAAPSIDGVVAA